MLYFVFSALPIALFTQRVIYIAISTSVK